MSAESVTTPALSWESLNDFPIRLRSGLRFRAEGPGNDWICFLEDAEGGRSFAMSPWQRWFVELVDSKTPVQDAARMVMATFPDVVSDDAVRRFIGWMLDEQLFEKIATVPAKTTPPVENPAVETSSLSGLRLLAFGGRLNRISINGIAILLIALGAWMLNPAADEAPTEILNTAESTAQQPDLVVPIRAVSSGILSEVLVRDGDEVREGDLVARIDDPVELQRLQDLKLQLGESRIRRDRFYQAAATAEYQAEMRRIAQLSRQIGISEALASLAEMRAPVTGLVETEVLCGKVGSDIIRGDVLFQVHLPDADARELLAVTP